MERSRDLGPYRQGRSMKGALKVWLDVAYGARANRGFPGGAPRMLVQRSVISTSTATHLTYDVFR